MYESPIKMLESEIVAQWEGNILNAVKKVGIEVDKEELLRALEYDRDQYMIGFLDGRNQIVHCGHCTIKKAVPHKDGIVWRCPHRTGDVKMEGYCESGVRGNGS